MRLDFEDLESVRPVETDRLGGIVFLVEDGQVGREASFVKNPTLKLRAVDVIGLRNSRFDPVDPTALGPRQNVENSVGRPCQRFIERLLQRGPVVAALAVPLEITEERGICLDGLDD